MLLSTEKLKGDGGADERVERVYGVNECDD